MGERLTEGHGQQSLQKPAERTGTSRLSQLKREVQVYATISALVPLVLFTVLSDRQRRSIRDDRDGGKCQFPGEHTCTPDDLEVHHISPQRWEEDMGIPEEIRDRPVNLLTICYNAHQKEVHPDMQMARNQYRKGNRQGFKDVFVARKRKVDRRQPYWNTAYDAAMLRRAKQLTANAEGRGWHMPDKKKRGPSGTLAAA